MGGPETHMSTTTITVCICCFITLQHLSLVFQRYPKCFLNCGPANHGACLVFSENYITTVTEKLLIFRHCSSLSEPSFNELLDDMIIG